MARASPAYAVAVSWVKGKGSGPDWTAAIIYVALGGALAVIGGFIGAAFLFGNPPAKHFWFPVMVVLLVLGTVLMAIGSHRAERSRKDQRP